MGAASEWSDWLFGGEQDYQDKNKVSLLCFFYGVNDCLIGVYFKNLLKKFVFTTMEDKSHEGGVKGWDKT